MSEVHLRQKRKFVRHLRHASGLLLLVLALLSGRELLAQPASDLAGPVLEVYVRDGCPHCAEAKLYLPTFAAARPGLRITLRPVDQDENARNELIQLHEAAGIWPPGVPAFVFNGRLLVGFDTPETTGPELAALVDGAEAPVANVENALFGTLSVERLGLPLFTLALGLLDGFNPCAMWVLLFLLSLLVHLHDRKRMALIAGTFVLASGLVYYAFMAAWLNIFLIVGFSTLLRLGLGTLAVVIGAVNVKDFLHSGAGVSLSIPASAKPGLYARMRAVISAGSLPLSLGGVAMLAVVVNFVELLCTAGFPAIYTAVLTQQGLPPLAHYGYLALYIFGYLVDDSLMVASAVMAMGSRKLTERAGRSLKLLSGLVMVGLGLVLLLRPTWLL